MTGADALDIQLADLGYTDGPDAHFRALARAEVARLRAVEANVKALQAAYAAFLPHLRTWLHDLAAEGGQQEREARRAIAALEAKP